MESHSRPEPTTWWKVDRLAVGPTPVLVDASRVTEETVALVYSDGNGSTVLPIVRSRDGLPWRQFVPTYREARALQIEWAREDARNAADAVAVAEEREQLALLLPESEPEPGQLARGLRDEAFRAALLAWMDDEENRRRVPAPGWWLDLKRDVQVRFYEKAAKPPVEDVTLVRALRKIARRAREAAGEVVKMSGAPWEPGDPVVAADGALFVARAVEAAVSELVGPEEAAP